MPISTTIPSKGLDLDSDYSNVQGDSYVDANDIKIKSDGSSNGYLVQNFNGNEILFSLGGLQAQNKQFLIEEGTDGTAYTINLYDAYNNLLKTATNTVFATLITQFDAALAAGTPISYTKTTATYNSKLQVSYTFTSIPYYDYKLENTGNQFGFLYIVKEIVDDSEAALGAKKIIKSVQGQNGVYIFSTNQAVQDSGDNLISVLSANVTTDAGFVKILTAGVTLPVGVSNGSYFRANINSTIYSGVHIAKVNVDGSITFVDLPYSSSVDLTYEFYISNYGEIGYVDFESGTYTIVYSTTQWDFSIFYPIDARTEVSALGFDQIYFCSKIDRIRVFYAQTTGVYQYNTSFGLTLVPQYHELRGGNYNYETILAESLLQLQNTSSVTLSSQTGGGTVKAGNWRYAVSLVTQNGSAESELSDICNPINVDNYSPNNNFFNVYGNLSDTDTDKTNILIVNDIRPNVYQYVILYGFHYANGATAAYRIKQQLLPNDATTAIISHFGTETAELVSFSELQFSTNYYKAQNVELIDNRLTFSNVEQEGNYDFTEFAQSITHNIQSADVVQTGEYKNPYNVCNEVGYMVNEDYVFSAQFELYSGITTNQVYYINTIRIDGDTTNNAANPNIPNGGRVAGGTSDMRIATPTGIKKIYPQFIIDWDNALINGVLARTIIKSVKFYRAEVVNPRVIACGLLIPCVRLQNPPVGYSFSGANPLTASPSPTDIFAYPDFATSAAYPGNYRNEWNGGTQQNFAFYTPDYYYLGNRFDYLSGDELIIESGITQTASLPNNPTGANPSSFSIFYGDQTAPTHEGNPYTVDLVSYCTTGAYTDMLDLYGKRFHNELNIAVVGSYNAYSCHIITVDTAHDLPIYRPSGNASYGYYIRPRSDQYGDLSLLRYIYTGVTQNEADCPLLTTTPAKINKGGDTFNQYSALKQRVCTTQTGASKWRNAGVAFYTQNRINSQMRVKVGTNYNYYPAAQNISSWLSNLEPEAINYDSGYNIFGNNYINTLTPFDPNIPSVTKYGSRAVWTNEKPAGSLVDDYRIIPPLNFYDFPMSDGDITAHIKVNRVLYFLQPYRFSQKYFNSEGQFNTVSGDNIVLGENAVMSRREQDLSGFGSRHKESIQLGFTEGGKESLYWVCSDYKKIMRYGYDGTVVISDRARIKSWCERIIIDAFNTNTNSCLGIGISGGWNQKDKEYIATFKYGTNVDNPLTINTSIAFSEVTNRFTSFYSAKPTIYLPFKNVYLTPNSVYYGFYPSQYLSENTGDIYLHDDDNVINVLKPTYYGTPYNTNISLVSNQDPVNNKLFQNFEIDFDFDDTITGLGAYSDILFTTKYQVETSVDPLNCEVALDLLRGQVPVENAVGERNFSGLWIKCKSVFKNTGIGNLQRLTVKYLTSNRYASR